MVITCLEKTNSSQLWIVTDNVVCQNVNRLGFSSFYEDGFCRPPRQSPHLRWVQFDSRVCSVTGLRKFANILVLGGDGKWTRCSFLAPLQLLSSAVCYFVTVGFHLGVGSVPLRSKLFVLLWFSSL